MQPKSFVKLMGDKTFGPISESENPSSGIAAIVGFRNQVMGSWGKKRMHLTRRRPTEYAFDKKETLFFPRDTFLFVKFIISLL